MNSPRFQVSPGSRSEYLYAFAPTQNFQEIENSISNAYLSKVLPAKTPQSLFRLFAEYSCAAGSSSIIRFYSWNYTETIV